MGMDPATIGLIISAVSAGMGAVSSIREGKAAKAQADYQAAVQRQQAKREQMVAAAREADFRREQSRLMAQRRAIMGASGVETGTGSPLIATEDFATEKEVQALRLRNQGDVASTRLEEQALLTGFAGQNAKRSAYGRAGAQLLSGIGTVYKGYSAGPKAPTGDTYAQYQFNSAYGDY